MKNKPNWLITDNNVTVNYEGQTHIVPRTDALADKLIQALKEKNYQAIPELVSVSKRVEKFSDGQFTVKDGTIFVKGVAVSPVLGNKIVKFSNEGLPYEPLVKFAENLQANPSYRAVQELFVFLEKNDHPLTDEGNFIAYKRVRSTFKDIHSNTMDNSPGKVVSMPRNQVNEDSSVTCSHGLHVANWDYAHNHFASHDGGDIMLEVEVNPKDVVSIPVDYDNAKIRVCEYKVLRVVDEENSSDTHLRYTSKPEWARRSTRSTDMVEYNYCRDCGAECEEDYEVCVDCEDESTEREFVDDESSSDDDWNDDESSSDEEYPWEDEL